MRPKHADELAKNDRIDFLINFKPRSIVMEIIDHGPGF